MSKEYLTIAATCPHCGSTLFTCDEETAEFICTACGEMNPTENLCLKAVPVPDGSTLIVLEDEGEEKASILRLHDGKGGFIPGVVTQVHTNASPDLPIPAATEELLKLNANNALNSRPHYLQYGAGCWTETLDADPADGFSDRTVYQILTLAGEAKGSTSIREAFEQVLSHDWCETTVIRHNELTNTIIEEVADKLGYHLSVQEKSFLRDYLLEVVFIDPPMQDYLKRRYDVTIMLDTGDGNWDYTLNSRISTSEPMEVSDIHDAASLVWLAQQQGYTKDELSQLSCYEGDSKFLHSVCKELKSIGSSMTAVSFCVNMTLEDILDLNIAMMYADSKERKPGDVPTVRLQKGTCCGLLDVWYGISGDFDITLENDVLLPVEHIRVAIPDKAFEMRGEYGAGIICTETYRGLTTISTELKDLLV